jgi:hypothetical protein
MMIVITTSKITKFYSNITESDHLKGGCVYESVKKA